MTILMLDRDCERVRIADRHWERCFAALSMTMLVHDNAGHGRDGMRGRGSQTGIDREKGAVVL